MKISCAKDVLLSGIQNVQSVVSAKEALPILLNVLIEAEGKNIFLSTTDLEIGIKCGIEADVKRKGGTTIPAKKLFNIVRNFPADSIEIDVTENNIATIASKNDSFKIMGLSEGDFPKIPELKGAPAFTVKKDTLKDLIRKTSYAVSQEETRYSLNGIFVKVLGQFSYYHHVYHPRTLRY